ncbi:MAG: hypothetical protein ACETWG_00600 [Candidatus Neomarinimicrobiota bacterium]
MSANCCPDSNRFTLSSKISKDLISITVLDTASKICRCICPYTIHAEFNDLPRDFYDVHITADTYYDTLIYQESVQRNH